MYKLIIVEDEEQIRNGLKNLIDWKNMGYEVVSDFSNAFKALEFIEENEIHVILTDVNMKGMTGIDLAKSVRERKLDIRIVFISGYKEFEYAKSAIAYAVENYLLKPVKLDELFNVFTTLKQNLDNESNEKQQYALMEKRLGDAIAEMEEQVAYSLISGAIRTQDQFNRNQAIMGNRRIIKNYKIAVIQLVSSEDWIYGIESLWTGVMNIIDKNKTENINLIPVKYEIDKLVLFFWGIDDSEVLSNSNMVGEFINILETDIKQILKVNILLAQSQYYEELFETNVRYNNALKDLDIKVENVNIIQDTNKFSKERLKLTECIFQGDVTGTENLILKELENIYIAEKDDLSIKNRMVELISTVYTSVVENIRKGPGVKAFDYSIIFISSNVFNLKYTIAQYFSTIAEELGKNSTNVNNEMVQKAKEYIDLNYKTDISLNLIAEYVFLSPIYLSRIFKHTTGRNFIDYLTDLRIQKAKEMLEEKNYMVYQIGEKVGYNNQKYFSRIFKQYTGYTPTEYQKIRGQHQ